ncbi:MAG: hypothetical protein Tsb0013_08260 [Phycisphaerales bacterium]
MLLTSILSIFALALVAPYAHKLLGRFAAPALAAVPAYWFVRFASFLDADHPGALTEVRPWVDGLDVSLAFRLDGLALLMALLITGIGTCVVVYAGSYLHGHRHHARFFAYLLAFMGSMLGVVLSDDLIGLFIFWELTSVTSFLLIGFDHQKSESRRSAMQALLVTGLGGLALLAGLLMLGLETGSWRLSEIIADPELARSSALYTPATLLILLGCFTKSAVFPFHFWLPGAMAAPTPVSAYLHSSTMVKAGVFLLARLQPALGDTPLWQGALIGFGGFTMLVAVFLATRQTYFKKLLAYSTVSSLATMIMLIGMGETGAHAAMAYLFCHALFKGALFMIAGIADHETGVKDVERLGGLRRLMPVTSGAALLAAISMAGAPPMVGFAAKELMIKASMDAPVLPWLVTLATVAGGAMMVMVAITVGVRPFFGKQSWHPVSDPLPKAPHEAPPSMLAGPVALGALGLIAAFLPGLFADPIVRGATDALIPQVEHTSAAIHHIGAGASGADAGHGDGHYSLMVTDYLFHPSLALALSLLAVLGGVALYSVRAQWRKVTDPAMRALTPFGPQAAYLSTIEGIQRFADVSTSVQQNGSLSSYLRTVLIAATGLGFYGLMHTGRPLLTIPEHTAPVGFFETVLVVLAVVGAIGATLMRSRLAAILSMGITGLCVATLFVIYGAPDVAMTQFSIETLSAIILILVVWRLPQFKKLTSGPRRAWDATVALGFGAMMTAFVLIAVDEQFAAPISAYFAAESYHGTETAGAHGRNIVNVILVDFRGFDTMGEITVLGLAAIGVYTLVHLRSKRHDTVPVPPPFFERRGQGGDA